MVVVVVAYWAQSVLGRVEDERARKQIVFAGVGIQLVLLGFFKYFGFFSESFLSLAQRIGWDVSVVTTSIVLPVGISFYVFQAIGLIVDSRKGVCRAGLPFLDVAFFIAFFPQLVAGPIVRATDFIPQIARDHRFSAIPVNAVLVLFITGYFKKSIVADNLALLYVDPVFDNPGLYSSTGIWLAVVAYAIQIYCDFSGYSDMAIAVSRCFGYQLPINFTMPYFSSSVTEFWRRWHMSLSQWLRDYVYIPLGGSRTGEFMTVRNLMATMVLGGIWHGASWNFLFWGYLQGGALVLERLFANLRKSDTQSLSRLFRVLAVFLFTCFSWVFFRSVNFSVSAYMISSMLGFGSAGGISFGASDWVLVLALCFVHLLFWKYQLAGRIVRSPWWLVVPVGGIVFAIMLVFVPVESKPFIYFQF